MRSVHTDVPARTESGSPAESTAPALRNVLRAPWRFMFHPARAAEVLCAADPAHCRLQWAMGAALTAIAIAFAIVWQHTIRIDGPNWAKPPRNIDRSLFAVIANFANDLTLVITLAVLNTVFVLLIPVRYAIACRRFRWSNS